MDKDYAISEDYYLLLGEKEREKEATQEERNRDKRTRGKMRKHVFPLLVKKKKKAQWA